MSARALVAALLLLAAGALPAAAQSFVVSGRFLYEDKAWNYNGWTGADPVLPIRRADVTVLNAATSAVLGTGTTGADGSFSISASAAGITSIAVRCDADNSLDAGFQRVRVTTEGSVEYAVLSPVFPGHSPALPLDIGTVTALKVLSGGAEGGPFNMYDMGLRVAEYLASPKIGAAPSSSTLRLYWPGGSGSFATSNQAHIADDDGYDDPVILHELGHVVMNLYSDNDSPGGSHFFGDSDQDPRLSWGEGFATFLGGIVQDHMGLEALYFDGNAAAQSGGVGLNLRLETAAPYASDAYGAADEVAVACALFDLLDTEFSPDGSPGSDDDTLTSTVLVQGKSPPKAFWDTLVGPVKAASNCTINDFWDGWFGLHAADAHFDELMDCFSLRRIRFWADNDEPDNSLAEAFPAPAVSTDTWSGEKRLYWSTASPPAPGSGDQDWYRLDLVKGSRLRFETRYPGGAADADTQCDTFLEVYRPGGILVASADGGGPGRNALVDDVLISETGTWYYKVRSVHAYRRYGRYNARAQYLFENKLPQITAGPTASPPTIPDSQTTLLSVTASDPDVGQTLVYAWTPLAGGSISGSGAVVTFTPPSVSATSVVPVQLVVSDDLGASTAPLIVEVTVTPDVSSPCPGPASTLMAGAGKPGLFGVPLLSAQNLPKIPSGDFAIHASNLLPLASGYLVVGFSLISAPFDLGTLHPSPDLLLPIFTGGAGQLLLPITLAADPLLCGLTVHTQVLVLGDPGAAGPKQSAQSNRLSLTFGN